MADQCLFFGGAPEADPFACDLLSSLCDNSVKLGIIPFILQTREEDQGTNDQSRATMLVSGRDGLGSDSPPTRLPAISALMLGCQIQPHTEICLAKYTLLNGSEGRRQRGGGGCEGDGGLLASLGI